MEFEEVFYRINEAMLVCESHERDFDVLAVNNIACQLLGRAEETTIGNSLIEFLPLDSKILIDQLEYNGAATQKFCMMGPFNTPQYIKLDAYETFGSANEKQLIVHLKDISIEQRHSERLGVFRGIYNASDEGLMIFDVDGRLEWMNTMMSQLLNAQRHHMIGLQLETLIDFYPRQNIWSTICGNLKKNIEWNGEVWDLGQDLQSRTLEMKIRRISNDAVDKTYFAVIVSDVTELKKKEREVQFLSNRDKLTGLFNLHYFTEKLEKESMPGDMAIYFIDLQGFGRINASLGHANGDRILKIVASRLLGNINDLELAGRVGSDKFIVCSPYRTGIDPALRGHQLLDVFHKEVSFEGHQIQLSANVGYAVGPCHGRTYSELIKSAEIATKHAHSVGIHRLGAFDQFVVKENATNFRLEQDIRQAVNKEEFYLMFQPIVDTFSKDIAGFEALVRWRHPELGEISPKVFIPIAESSGIISSLGEWVIEDTFSCLKTLNAILSKPLFASINVSIRQLEQPTFIRHVRRALEHHGLKGNNIEFEITESVYMENIDAIFENLKALNELGIRISIDDFGTGYSSLSQLFRIDVSKIKIDKSFIDGLSLKEESNQLTEAVTLIAKSLDLKLVAEGVETEAQLSKLKDLSCDFVQGYYFSRPLSLKDFCSYIGLGEVLG